MSERRGVFITLEGGEGAGKSTAAAKLAELLHEEGHDVVVTREPGGTPGAEAIRKLLLEPTLDLSPMAQTMLHFAARIDHVSAKIRPTLAAGKIVLCDRFYDSTMAYQAWGQGVDVAAVASLIRMTDLVPDLTFMLDVSDSVAEARRAARRGIADRYELMDVEMRERIAHGFQAIATAEPGRCALINADATPERVVSSLRETIKTRLGI